MEWRRVNEELPDENEQVLCYNRTESVFVRFVEGAWVGEFGALYEKGHFSHWIRLDSPLPDLKASPADIAERRHEAELDALHRVIDKMKREEAIRMFELRGIAADLDLDPEASVDQIRERAAELLIGRRNFCEAQSRTPCATCVSGKKGDFCYAPVCANYRGLDEEPDTLALLQDFACGVSEAIWGGELGWCRPTEQAGLKKLLEEVRRRVVRKSERIDKEKTFVCPQCVGPLVEVVQSSNSMLNAEQFESQKAGDYYCPTCPDNDRGKDNKCYWWLRELPFTEDTK